MRKIGRPWLGGVILFGIGTIGADNCALTMIGDPVPASNSAPPSSSGDACVPYGGQGGMGGGGTGGAGPGGADVTGAAVGAGGGEPGNPRPQDLTCGGGDDAALLQEDLQNADTAGGVACGAPGDCVSKCVAQAKYCWAAHAVHPYKPPMVGDLYQCIDRTPPASLGGSYTCLYQYPNGDACIFAYGAKLGPITLPAPPPLCVYKSP